MYIRINECNEYTIDELKNIWRSEKLTFKISKVDVISLNKFNFNIPCTDSIGIYFTIVYAATFGQGNEEQIEFGIGPIVKGNLVEGPEVFANVYFFNNNGFIRLEKICKLNPPWAKIYDEQ